MDWQTCESTSMACDSVPQSGRGGHDRDVRVGVGMRGMQLAAQFFHEDPDRAANVRNRQRTGVQS